MKKTLFILLLFLTSCKAGEKTPLEDKTQNSASIQTSTSSINASLSAPAEYVKNTVSQVDKAKSAVNVYNKAAAEHMEGLDQGGN